MHVSLCVITRIHVGMERDGDKCYGCEQRKLNPAGKPNTPWRAPILSECDQLAISVPDSAASSASMTCMPATGATLVRDGWGENSEADALTNGVFDGSSSPMTTFPFKFLHELWETKKDFDNLKRQVLRKLLVLMCLRRNSISLLGSYSLSCLAVGGQ